MALLSLFVYFCSLINLKNMTTQEIITVLGEERAKRVLDFNSPAISKDRLHLPNPSFIDDVWKDSNRSNQVLNSLAALNNNGRLSGTGYVSILPVDQGIEHTAGSSFAPNPAYFDPENIVINLPRYLFLLFLNNYMNEQIIVILQLLYLYMVQ